MTACPFLPSPRLQFEGAACIDPPAGWMVAKPKSGASNAEDASNFEAVATGYTSTSTDMIACRKGT